MRPDKHHALAATPFSDDPPKYTAKAGEKVTVLPDERLVVAHPDREPFVVDRYGRREFVRVDARAFSDPAMVAFDQRIGMNGRTAAEDREIFEDGAADRGPFWPWPTW